MRLLLLLLLLHLINRSYGQAQCLETVQGINYLGTVTVSVNGPCEYWFNATGNVNYNQDSQFPDATVLRAQNYCRNPKASSATPYDKQPWCWLKADSRTFAYCNIPLCTTLGVCRSTYRGETYTGTVAKTASNKPCLPWASVPAASSFFNPNSIQGETITQASNFCRNPDNNTLGLWCYTSTSPLAWEQCMTDLCPSTLDCGPSVTPYSFKSLTTNEQYMGTCALWSTVWAVGGSQFNASSPTPAILNAAVVTNVDPFFNAALMPDLSFDEAQNQCRNPDNDTAGAWCYVQSGSTYTKKYCKTPCSGIWACLYDRVGAYYQGTVSITESGDTCQSWSSQTPNPVTFATGSFPDKSIVDASNYCRNPSRDPGGPWCYRSTTAGPPNFGYCTLPTCLQTPPIPPLTTSPNTSACQSTSLGLEYTGTVATTISGKTCQSWSATTPKLNPYFNRPILFNTSTMAEVSNYCRNPNRLLTGPWCITTDLATYSESCNLPKCFPGPRQNCRLTLAGTEYNGTINVTASNQPCLLWAQIANLAYNDSNFADGFISSALNYCRNPQKPNWLGTFCYVAGTQAGAPAYESPCVVPMCSTSTCRTTSEGYTYTGTQATTLSGKACLPWSTVVSSIDPDMLPDATIAAASNFCRNPNKGNKFDGPFCYYKNADSSTGQETCGINYCTTQCRNTQLGTDYAGIISRATSMDQCLNWTDPRNINFRNPADLNAATLESASNYCRNPDKDPLGLWCYTAGQTKGYCFVAPCGPSGTCYTPNNAWAYTGTVNVTNSSLPCATWKGFVATPGLSGPTLSEALLPEPIAQSINYCRAPTSDPAYLGMPWCFLDISNLPTTHVLTTNFGFCNVTICVTTTAPSTTSTSTTAAAIKTNVLSACYTAQNISSYNGYNNVTISGTPCLFWANMNFSQFSQVSGPTFNSAFLPGETAAAASNYCRIPTNQTQYSSQPWCYVNPALATKAEAVQNFGFCSFTLCNSTNSTQIMLSPAFNIFIAFTIVVSSLSLSHSALVFFDGAVSTTETATFYLNRPLPDQPTYAEEIIAPANNSLVNAPPAGGIQEVPIAASAGNMLASRFNYATSNPSFVTERIEANQVQMNAAQAPPITGSGMKVIGSGSDMYNSANTVANIMNLSNSNVPVAFPNKVVATGYDQTYSYSVGGNFDSFIHPMQQNQNAAIVQKIGMPNIIAEGFDEQYTYNVAGNVAQLQGSSGGHYVESLGGGNGGLKIIAMGSDGGAHDVAAGATYSSGGSAGGNGDLKVLGSGSGYSNEASGNGSGGLKIIAFGSEAASVGASGKVAGEAFGGASSMVAGGASGGASSRITVGASGGSSSRIAGGASGGASSRVAGGASGGTSSRVAGGASGGASSRAVDGAFGGTSGMVAGSASSKGLGEASSGASSGVSGGSSVNSLKGSTGLGNVNPPKSIYYDINLNDLSGSGMVKKYEVVNKTVEDGSGGVTIIQKVKESNVSESSLTFPTQQQPPTERPPPSSTIPNSSNNGSENLKEDTYYSILEDWNPLG